MERKGIMDLRKPAEGLNDEVVRLRAVNAKLLAALEVAEKEADYDGCNNCRYIHQLARAAIEEAKK
jgi:hypothetical protein